MSADFPIVGVSPSARPLRPDTFARHVHRDELAGVWRRCARIDGRTPDGADSGIGLGYDAEVGYLLDLPGAGLFSVSPDGRMIRCAPVALEGWRWQHGLFAGPLPFAALVRGMEVFHASAVVLDERLIAITGASGSGKTSLAAFLRLAGARFFTDDVLALEAREQVIAHPGPSLFNLPRSTAQLLSAAERAQLGTNVGFDRAQARIATEAFPGPQPMAALYFLDRRADADGLSFESVTPSGRLLLASSYNFVIRSQERLLRQLDVCSRLAKATSMTRIGVPRNVDARTLAAAIIQRERARAG